MLEIKDRCMNCLHSKVCSKKGFYANAQETLEKVDFSVVFDEDKNKHGMIGINNSKDILVSINCPYYFGGYSSVKSITSQALDIDGYKYNYLTNTTSDACTAYDYAETKEN